MSSEPAEIASHRSPSRLDTAIDAAGSKPSRPPRPRVWRACEVCRKRKIRCDGQDPCNFCTTNQKECTFTRPEDHASSSRQRDNDTQARLNRLEEKLDRLIPLIETTHHWYLQANAPSSLAALHAAESNSEPSHTFPASKNDPLSFAHSPTHRVPADFAIDHDSENRVTEDVDIDVGAEESLDSRDGTDLVDGNLGGEDAALTTQTTSTHLNTSSSSTHGPTTRERSNTWADRLAGQFAQDSTGNMRYLGGAPTFVLAQAVDSVRQAQIPIAEDDPTGPSSRGPTVDHLYFRPNVLYRPLEGLPSPATITYPPLIVSDALVHVYFERIHHTFPIVDKPRFLRKYGETIRALQSGRPSNDSHFLCILFAVYASAASLTKTVFEDRADLQFSSPREYVGLEFYEKALYMYWTGCRLMTVEHVTCMAVLASCLAGWNTLSQAWVLAGQAVRGAQDLGLHRSPNKTAISEEAKEYRRRVWWCVFGLDKILSVSLGRPSGVNDDDCDVELPSDEICCQDADSTMESPGNNPMTGIISLLKITTIAGRIERTAHNISFLKTYDNSADDPHVRQTVDQLDAMLAEWSETLPAPIKYAANNPNRPSMFALCLLGHFTLYACTLNLHRPFMPDCNSSSREYTFKSLERCMSAAQGCIRVGEEVRKHLPNSHHCQFCVQYLTVSGVTLLRCLPYVADSKQLVTAATRCRLLLAQLEDTWPGSKRCGALLQDLLDICGKKRPAPRKKPTRSRSIRSHQHDSLPAQPNRVEKRHPDHLDMQGSQPAPKRRATTSHNAERTSPGHLHGPPSTVAASTGTTLENMAMSEQGNTALDSVDCSLLDMADVPFDITHFTDLAPFDIGDEIGALLDQMQTTNTEVSEPDWSQWSTWGTG